MKFRMAQNAASSPSQVLIWNLDIGEPVKMIDCHTDVILCMSFNTDGSLLATACKDKKLRVVEPRSGRVLQVRGLGGGCEWEHRRDPQSHITALWVGCNRS